MSRENTPTRRGFIGGIVTGTAVTLSGCAGGDNGADPSEPADGFEGVLVEGVDLVIEFGEDHPFDSLSVIQPGGELLVERDLAPGVRRESIELGTTYQPGEYEIIGVSDGDEAATTSLVVEPDVAIESLRLGRNHPDEMYEGASDRTVLTEAILTIENTGNGPDAAVSLEFSGDIPRPTPNDSENSGIYDTDSELGGHADQVVLPPDETVVIYSHSTPFNPASDNVSCTPDGESGEFEVEVSTSVQEPNPSQQYSVTYTGEDLTDCDIEIGVVQ